MRTRSWHEKTSAIIQRPRGNVLCDMWSIGKCAENDCAGVVIASEGYIRNGNKLCESSKVCADRQRIPRMDTHPCCQPSNPKIAIGDKIALRLPHTAYKTGQNASARRPKAVKLNAGSEHTGPSVSTSSGRRFTDLFFSCSAPAEDKACHTQAPKSRRYAYQIRAISAAETF